MSPLTFEILLNPAETVRVAQTIERRARTPRTQLLWIGFMALPFLIAGVFGVPFSTLIIYVGLLIAFAAFTAFLPAIRRWQVGRFYRDTPSLAGPQRYEFSDAGIAISNANASNLIRWSAITEAAELPDVFLLYYSKKCAYYVPKRVIPTEAEIDALRALLHANLGARAAAVALPT